MVEIVPTINVKSKEDFLKRITAIAPLVSRVQWDIMDGKFVENTTFSDPSILDELFSDPRPLTPDLKIGVDLMVEDPQNWIERFHHPGIEQLIFHVESKSNLQDWDEILLHARALGFKIGIAAEPDTDISSFSSLLPLVDLYQAMGGRSGFAGKGFNPEVLPTIKKIRQDFPHLPISVDIGVTAQTAPDMVKAGVTVLVSGSVIFTAKDPKKALESLRNATL